MTIDSSEPLEDALRVLSAVYQVTLTVGSSAEPRRGATVARKPRGNARRRKRGRTQVEPVSNAELRSWAREQGYTVADRGRLPREVVQAYQGAHSN